MHNDSSSFSSSSSRSHLVVGRCGRHHSPPASSVMDFAFRRSDGSHVSGDTVHPSLLRSSSLSSYRVCRHTPFTRTEHCFRAMVWSAVCSQLSLVDSPQRSICPPNLLTPVSRVFSRVQARLDRPTPCPLFDEVCINLCSLVVVDAHDSAHLGDLHASGLIVGLNCRSPDQTHPVKINILLLLLLLLLHLACKQR